MPKPIRLPFGPPLEVKSIDDAGRFEGYASLFNREDLGQDVLLRGAFADSLRRRGAAGIRLLYQHDPTEPIGVWDELKEDHKGLYARGRLLLGVARAREVLALMQAGALDGLSIGFKAIAARRDARTGLRHLTKVDLWEISIVTFPMLPEARVAALKSQLTRPRTRTAREFEAWLTSEGHLTRNEARAFLAHGLRGLHALDAAQAKTTHLARAIRSATAAMRP